MLRVTPYKLVITLSVSLILGGIVLLVQGISFEVYRIGFVTIIAGAVLQIIMGNLDPRATWLQTVKVFFIGLLIFLFIVFISIRVVPLIYKWL